MSEQEQTAHTDLLNAAAGFVEARKKQMTQTTKKERFDALCDAVERSQHASAR
jgi:hypothetical protein